MNKTRLYTLQEVSEILQMSRQTLYAYADNGRLKAFKIGREWRVAPHDLREFISNGSNVEVTEFEETDFQPPHGYKINPEYLEKKARRVQLLIQPSLHEQIKTAADNRGLSLNEFIHRTMEKEVGC